jgi:hypothetical protein
MNYLDHRPWVAYKACKKGFPQLQAGQRNSRDYHCKWTLYQVLSVLRRISGRERGNLGCESAHVQYHSTKEWARHLTKSTARFPALGWFPENIQLLVAFDPRAMSECGQSILQKEK